MYLLLTCMRMASTQTWSAGRNPSLAHALTASQVAMGTRANLTAQIAAMVLYSSIERGMSIVNKFCSGALTAFCLDVLPALRCDELGLLLSFGRLLACYTKAWNVISSTLEQAFHSN